MNFGPFAKAINGSLVAVLAVFVLVLPGGISVIEWFTVGGVLVTNAVTIYSLRNTEHAPYAKAIGNGIVTALGVVVAALLQGEWFSTELILSAVIALLNTFLVVPHTPNAQESDDLIVQDVEDTEHARLDYRAGVPEV